MNLAGGQPAAECDFVVVGGGILGLATAGELLRRNPGARLALLEREQRLASHQTGHTSGVVHAGVYYEPGSLKARLCQRGARELRAFCELREIPFHADGKLILAVDESELPRLDELERRARENGVPGLQRLGAGEIAAVEPHAKGIAALHSPETAVVDFSAVARALAAEVTESGGSVHTGCPVRGIRASGGRVTVEYSGGATSAGRAVFCAGLWADRLAVAAGAPAEPRIVPFRGAYLILNRPELVRASVYPVPDPALPFLGAHLTRTVDGRVLIGPSALVALARDAYRPWRVAARRPCANPLLAGDLAARRPSLARRGE